MRFFKISKEQSIVMRGMAILAIAAHNMLHCVGYIPENESSFVRELPSKLLHNVMAGTNGWLGDILSFFGHYGVPVFVFLSGYGLAKKYETQDRKLDVKTYLVSNYLKLLLLVLPTTIFLIGLAFYEGTPKVALYYTAGLAFLNDFVFNWFPPQPGVYWYFGLTLQLYVIYIFLHNSDNRILIWCLIGGLILLAICNPALLGTPAVLKYVRHNAIGWLPVFVFGVFWARNDGDYRCPSYMLFIKVIVSSLLLFLFSFEYHAWLLTPFAALLLFMYLSDLIVRTKILRSVFVWLGTISSSIFVVHPIVRNYLTSYVRENPWSGMLSYLLIVVIIAFLYSLLYNRLRNSQFVNKFCK